MNLKNKNVLEELLDLLNLEKIEENIFRGKSQNLGFGSVFGGQVIGQAISAAYKTIKVNLSLNSIHGYFLRPGDDSKPIIYIVEIIRDGKSFSTRRVTALQKGKPIFITAASFQINEIGFEHQSNMPNVVSPEELESELTILKRYKKLIPKKVRNQFLCDKPIEFRHVNPVDPIKPEKMNPFKYVWFRTTSKVPKNKTINQYLLAYASDFSLTATSLYPHQHVIWEPKMQVASLDHSMWFHRDFSLDTWHLYSMKSPNASQARGLSIGEIFTKKGSLIATVAQEGLIRYHNSNN